MKTSQFVFVFDPHFIFCNGGNSARAFFLIWHAMTYFMVIRQMSHMDLTPSNDF